MTLIKKKGNGSAKNALRQDLMDFFDIENFFDEPILHRPSLWNGSVFSKVPATNIRESEKEFVVELAAPGMSKNDFKVDIDENVLEIKAESTKEDKEEGKSYTRREYNYNSFYRSFNLPESVESEKIKAEYKNGILQIHLPKVPVAERKPVKEIAIS